MHHHALEVVTIRGGSAGPIAAAFAAGLGARTSLVEKAQLGGEYLWTGCVPSKALLHAAAVASTIRHAADAGIDAGVVGREQTRGTLRYVREVRGRVQEASASEHMLRSLGVETSRKARSRDLTLRRLKPAGEEADDLDRHLGRMPKHLFEEAKRQMADDTSVESFDLLGFGGLVRRERTEKVSGLEQRQDLLLAVC